MPTPLGEGMTGSRTNPALPQSICTITALEKAHNPKTIASLIFRHPGEYASARPGIKTVRPRSAAGAAP
jgi:hypothetical protein